MTVADLQQHLADLARLLESSGAKAVAADLQAVSQGLAPFREAPLKGFAEFLIRAEAYSQGEVPLSSAGRSRSGPGPAKAASPKAPAPDVDALSRELIDLYTRAAEASVTPDHVEAMASRLATLKKDALVTVSEGIGLKGMKSKSKDDILQAVRQRILARKGSSQRVGLIDRTESPAPQAPSVPGG